MPELLTEVASPSWAYLALLGLLITDAFVPVIPTQALMITSGALTVYGDLSLPVTIATGATGIFTGDVACYLLGRVAPTSRFASALRAESLARQRRKPGTARRAAGRVARRLSQPGPVVILVCRFVPAGRMAACFAAGRRHYPYRLFLLYETLAAVGWATYGALVGHLGGAALTGSAWRLAVIAAAAAVGFAAAGWAMTLLTTRTTPPADLPTD
ncbi:VTT domain-containing protein [Micromonospora sp. WMMA1363]|uniref:DedA family protein n=1 Tax=Micromonospora sp. WMMA1363 TaxID=3053985 RepID=UPI00259C705F|nr:VTT domain-containing protein [Micromonospora sp. WMMA1363]MDM4722460.1 VTT domain-containing protein [Micromonospora sp. WMMA1363]